MAPLLPDVTLPSPERARLRTRRWPAPGVPRSPAAPESYKWCPPGYHRRHQRGLGRWRWQKSGYAWLCYGLGQCLLVFVGGNLKNSLMLGKSKDDKVLIWRNSKKLLSSPKKKRLVVNFTTTIPLTLFLDNCLAIIHSSQIVNLWLNGDSNSGHSYLSSEGSSWHRSQVMNWLDSNKAVPPFNS